MFKIVLVATGASKKPALPGAWLMRLLMFSSLHTEFCFPGWMFVSQPKQERNVWTMWNQGKPGAPVMPRRRLHADTPSPQWSRGKRREGTGITPAGAGWMWWVMLATHKALAGIRTRWRPLFCFSFTPSLGGWHSYKGRVMDRQYLLFWTGPLILEWNR